LEDFRYNSAVYTSLAANGFLIAYVTKNHFEPGAYSNMTIPNMFRPMARNDTTGKEYGDAGYETDSHVIRLFGSMLEGYNGSTQSYEDLTPAQCTNLYNTDFLPSHRNLFLITNHTTNATYNNTLLDVTVINGEAVSGAGWICSHMEGPNCDPNKLASRVASGLPWLVTLPTGEVVEVVEVTGCKSERIVGKCKVQFSLGIMSAVICCNLVKACCMVMTVVRSREPTLVTLGDAVDSFLRIPDPTTMGICFADRQFIKREWGRGWRTGPRQWRQKGVRRWWTSVSKTRWIACNFLCSIAVITTGVLLGMGIGQDRVFVPIDIKSL